MPTNAIERPRTAQAIESMKNKSNKSKPAREGMDIDRVPQVIFVPAPLTLIFE